MRALFEYDKTLFCAPRIETARTGFEVLIIGVYRDVGKTRFIVIIGDVEYVFGRIGDDVVCLLYTSDAADEL